LRGKKEFEERGRFPSSKLGKGGKGELEGRGVFLRWVLEKKGSRGPKNA